jgi:hypothetical protein
MYNEDDVDNIQKNYNRDLINRSIIDRNNYTQPFSNRTQINAQFPNAESNGFTNPKLFTQQNGMHYYNGENVSHLHSGFSGRLTYHDSEGNQYETNDKGIPIDPNTRLPVDSSVQLYDKYNRPYHKSIFSWFGSGNSQPNNYSNNNKPTTSLFGFGGRRRKSKKGGKKSKKGGKKSRKSRRRRTSRM